VLFCARDEAILGDFGTATGAGEAPLGGTAGYLSPERIGGGRTDPRDDVYALGRIVEDVSVALGGADPGIDAPRFVARCLGPDRPPDARALLRLLAPRT
jgi:serine/threonine protein kinase